MASLEEGTGSPIWDSEVFELLSEYVFFKYRIIEGRKSFRGQLAIMMSDLHLQATNYTIERTLGDGPILKFDLLDSLQHKRRVGRHRAGK